MSRALHLVFRPPFFVFNCTSKIKNDRHVERTDEHLTQDKNAFFPQLIENTLKRKIFRDKKKFQNIHQFSCCNSNQFFALIPDLLISSNIKLVKYFCLCII